MDKFVFLVLAVSSIATISDAYVLLQVRKGGNQSNVDAVIHKVVPNKYKDLADDARKKLNGHKRYQVRGRAVDSDGLESIVLAINTGTSPNRLEKSNFVQKVQGLLIDFLKDDRVNTFFRSRKDSFNVKPEIVHFRSGKPSLMVEVNFQSIMHALKDALSSKKVQQYADKWAQKAAMVYRAIKDEVKRGDRAKRHY